MQQNLSNIFDLALTGKQVLLLLALLDVCQENYDPKDTDDTFQTLRETRRLLADQLAIQTNCGDTIVEKLKAELAIDQGKERKR